MLSKVLPLFHYLHFKTSCPAANTPWFTTSNICVVCPRSSKHVLKTVKKCHHTCSSQTFTNTPNANTAYWRIHSAMMYTFKALRSDVGKCFLNSFRRSKKEWKQSGTRMFWRGKESNERMWTCGPSTAAILLPSYSYLLKPAEESLCNTEATLISVVQLCAQVWYDHGCVSLGRL